MTLRLFDPVTGKLASYLLVKVLDDEGDLSVCSSNGKAPPLQAILDDLMESLKAVVREETSAHETHRTSHLKSRLMTNPHSTSRFSQAKLKASLPTAPGDPPARSPPKQAIRGHRRCDSKVLTGCRVTAAGLPTSPPSAHPSDDATVGREDGRAERPSSAVFEAAAVGGGCGIELSLPAEPVEDTPPAKPRTPTKTPAQRRAPHESISPQAIGFPPFLATSTPRAVARHRVSLALGKSKVTGESVEKDRTRRSTLPVRARGLKPSFDLGAFDPDAVSAVMEESNRRANVGVAPGL
ncbi:hypothetical protein L226DRAFT_229672 [Lentinus tigrinus ALCF2SS1-7]|nr:hypothetical protein L226DRAFT_229672 [Lentinus tigrinus ALCF2SS1-7]